jgi:hypothetical protein
MRVSDHRRGMRGQLHNIAAGTKKEAGFSPGFSIFF